MHVEYNKYGLNNVYYIFVGLNKLFWILQLNWIESFICYHRILLAYKLYYCKRNVAASVILVKTNNACSYGCKNENYAERN